MSTDSSAEGLNGAVGHAGCSQPAIVTAIPGLSAVGDGPQGQACCQGIQLMPWLHLAFQVQSQPTQLPLAVQ